MSTTSGKYNSIGSIKSSGQKAAFSRLMQVFTRLGYAVRGLIYIVMGLLSIGVVLGKGSAPTDMQGAIAEIGKQPAGFILLWVVLVGLISYSLWGVIRAVFDPLNKGHDLKGLLARGGFLFSAASYGLLILPTYGLILGAGRTAPGSQAQQFLASIMAMPLGPWLVGITGVAVIAGGLHQVYQGFKSSFDQQLQTNKMTVQEVKWAMQLGRFGTAARGFVFALVGLLLCLGAFQSNSGQAIGLDAALAALMRQPFGIWLLGIVAVGLIAFGIYSILSAVWFRLNE